MLRFQKDLTSSFLVFVPTRKRDAGQNPGATKIPLPLRAGDKMYSDKKHSTFQNDLQKQNWDQQDTKLTQLIVTPATQNMQIYCS